MMKFSFLISSERSGTNLLTSLMDGHPAICGPPPSHLFRLFGSNRGNYGDLEADANWETLIADLVLNLGCALGQWHTTVTQDELRKGVRRRSVAELLRFVYEKEASADGASHLFVKENHTYLFVPFLQAHFPDCRFVFLVRDPRDVASSFVNTAGIAGGVEKAMKIWVEDQTASLALFHQLRDSGRISLVRYEDLVRQPERELTRLVEPMGLSFEPQMLAAHRRRRSVESARRIEAWANLDRPVLSDNFGKYRSSLSEVDVRFVELVAWQLMAALRYPPELVTSPPGDDAAPELERLRPLLSSGSYEIGGAAEREIRQLRLAAIDRVLTRRL